jgi:acyl-CoA synthetase (AMP-forming)/AMP-acid ligase II
LRLPWSAHPIARTSEQVVAVLQQADGTATLDVAALHATLAAGGLAKFKWPERVIRIAELPRTPNGKIAKAEIRALLRSNTSLPGELR